MVGTKVASTLSLEDPLSMAHRGVSLCRRGSWGEGLDLLGLVAASKRPVELPGTFYSYLGHGLARESKLYLEGLSLCEYGMKVGVCEPENYLNMAKTLLLMNQRRKALGILNRGLALSPDHSSLVETRISLGVRRSPVVSFLGRSNLINRLLGRVRHALRSS